MKSIVMKSALAFVSAVALGLFAASASALNVTSISANGAVTSAANAAASNTYSHTSAKQSEDYGSIDGQSPLERFELVAKSNAGDCHATFTRSINRGNEATVLKTTYEPGGLMERYYIKEQGGRWYYASHFSAVHCK